MKNKRYTIYGNSNDLDGIQEAIDILKEIEVYQKEIERLRCIINEIKAIIYNNQIIGTEARLNIQEILDKVGSDK